MTSKDALARALEIIGWMTGSPDFAPGGRAYTGFLKFKPVIAEIESTLACEASPCQLPEWARLELQAYVISDSSGVHSKITLGTRNGRLDMSAINFGELLDLAIQTVNDGVGVTDTRAMTSAEVREYQEESATVVTDADDDDEEDGA